MVSFPTRASRAPFRRMVGKAWRRGEGCARDPQTTMDELGIHPPHRGASHGKLTSKQQQNMGESTWDHETEQGDP
eukprot:scaffold348_cov329-Pavlova_lutheri.AAC.48